MIGNMAQASIRVSFVAMRGGGGGDTKKWDVSIGGTVQGKQPGSHTCKIQKLFPIIRQRKGKVIAAHWGKVEWLAQFSFVIQNLQNVILADFRAIYLVADFERPERSDGAAIDLPWAFPEHPPLPTLGFRFLPCSIPLVPAKKECSITRKYRNWIERTRAKRVLPYFCMRARILAVINTSLCLLTASIAVTLLCSPELKFSPMPVPFAECSPSPSLRCPSCPPFPLSDCSDPAPLAAATPMARAPSPFLPGLYGRSVGDPLSLVSPDPGTLSFTSFSPESGQRWMWAGTK